MVLSVNALTSASCRASTSHHTPLVQLVALPPHIALASTIHHASTFRRAPLVRLVVALPGASPPPSCHDSAGCLGPPLLSYPFCLIGLLHHPSPPPILLLVVMLPLVSGLCLSFVTALGVVRRSCCRTHHVRRLLPQSVAQRREQVRVDGVQCSGNTVDAGPKSSIVVVRASCDKDIHKIKVDYSTIYPWSWDKFC